MTTVWAVVCSDSAGLCQLWPLGGEDASQALYFFGQVRRLAAAAALWAAVAAAVILVTHGWLGRCMQALETMINTVLPAALLGIGKGDADLGEERHSDVL